MALKDITLGQYFPGDTPIHRLDPRTKLLLTVVYIVALFLAKQVISYAILLVVLGVVIALSKVGMKAILRGMKPILIIVLITGVLNLFYTPGKGAPLVSFWVLNIYAEAARLCERIAQHRTERLLLLLGRHRRRAAENRVHKFHVAVGGVARIVQRAVNIGATVVESREQKAERRRADKPVDAAVVKRILRHTVTEHRLRLLHRADAAQHIAVRLAGGVILPHAVLRAVRHVVCIVREQNQVRTLRPVRADDLFAKGVDRVFVV